MKRTFFIFTITILALAIVTPTALAGEAEQTEEAVAKKEEKPWWTMDEAKLLARLIYSEARGETYQGQLAVAQCVLDRLESGKWGGTIKRVIYAPGQFAKPGKLTDDLLGVAIAALNGARAMPEHTILYFQVSKRKSKWYAPYITHIGAHAIYGYSEDIALTA